MTTETKYKILHKPSKKYVKTSSQAGKVVLNNKGRLWHRLHDVLTEWQYIKNKCLTKDESITDYIIVQLEFVVVKEMEYSECMAILDDKAEKKNYENLTREIDSLNREIERTTDKLNSTTNILPRMMERLEELKNKIKK